MKFSLLVATVVLSQGLLFALSPEFADMVVTNYVPSNAAGDAPEAIACDYVCDPTEPVATRPLVFRTQSQSQALPTILYYTHDGNKNVSELVTPNATVAAHYEYAPFGAVTVSSGMYALDNPFCFSSEYADNTLDLVYYNYRVLNSISGRWVMRDPVAEISDVCLYEFCGNEPIDYVDIAGLGKFGIVVRVGRWGLERLRWVSKDEAKRLYRKEGRDICGSKQGIKKMSKHKALETQGPEIHRDQYGNGTAHYHMPGKDRKTVTGKHGGHGFITRLTAAGWLGDHWYSEAIDFLNPFSDLSDLIELVDESAEISERDDEDANWQERECVPCN